MKTCAACGKVRATEDEFERLPPDCVAHRECPSCQDRCWYWNDRACADASGGWREVLASERARVASLTTERDQLAQDVRALERAVETLERERNELVARLN